MPRWFHQVGIAFAASSCGFSAVQAVAHPAQRPFFVALALYSVVAVFHDFRELQKCSQDDAALLTAEECREIMFKLHELHDGGHYINPEHVAAVLGWPLSKVRESLRLFRRCGFLSRKE
jgi:hypothetical protein